MTQLARVKRAASRAWTDKRYGAQRLATMAIRQCARLQELGQLAALRHRSAAQEAALARDHALIARQQKQLLDLQQSLKAREVQVEQLLQDREQLEQIVKTQHRTEHVRPTGSLPAPTVEPWSNLDVTNIAEITRSGTDEQLRAMVLDPRCTGIGPFDGKIPRDVWVASTTKMVQEEGLTQVLVNLLTVMHWGFAYCISQHPASSADAHVSVEYRRLTGATVRRRVAAPRDKWTTADVRAILCNPLTIGMGPFARLVSDELWVEAAIKLVNQEGLEQFLVNMLTSLRVAIEDFDRSSEQYASEADT